METLNEKRTASVSYEIAYLLAPELKEEEIAKTSQDIKNIIEANEGFVVEESKAKFQKLAYPIAKKDEAFFCGINFFGKSDSLAKIEKEIKGLSGLLRIFAVKPEQIKITTRMRERRKKISAIPQTKEGLEETEKKLEEILEKI